MQRIGFQRNRLAVEFRGHRRGQPLRRANLQAELDRPIGFDGELDRAVLGKPRRLVDDERSRRRAAN